MPATCQYCLKTFKNMNSRDTHNWNYKGSCAPEMSAEEYGLLSPVDGQLHDIHCKGCSIDVPKKLIFKHLAKHHREIEKESWEWWIKKDYNMIKQHKQFGNTTPFTVAYQRKSGMLPPVAGPGDMQLVVFQPQLEDQQGQEPQEHMDAPGSPTRPPPPGNTDCKMN